MGDNWHPDPDPNWGMITFGFTFVLFIWWWKFYAYLYKKAMEGPKEWTVERRGGRMNHLSGLRAVASIWIMATHYLTPGPGSRSRLDYPWIFGLEMRGGDTMVTLFVLLSGFFTHYAYADELRHGGSLLFYVRRIGRLLPVFYIAHFGSIAIVAGGPNETTMGNMVSTAFFMSTWWLQWTMTLPNRMLWTVVSLAWCWVFFPPFLKFLDYLRPKCNPRTYGLRCFGWGVFICWCLGMAPSMFMGDQVPILPYLQLKNFPPTLFLTFAAGALVAEAHLYIPPIKSDLAFAVFCDITAIGAVLCIAIIPRYTIAEATRQPECWFVHGYIGVWAMMLFASCRRPKGLMARFLGFRHLATLGEYAYHMYVLQYPVFTAIRKWRFGDRVTYERVALNEWVMNVCVAIFVSYFMCDWLEMPYVRLLKKVCDHIAVGMYGEKKKNAIILRTQSFKGAKQHIDEHIAEREGTPLPMTSKDGYAPIGQHT